ncbi:MAG: polysaccharide deacetylase family protein, partial [Chitinivibrionales bacterium]|nr:polysaccharide deacetylase family protein [Chitinivibrionales bacterium]
MNKQRVLFAVTLILTAIFISSTTAAITAKTTKWKDEAKAAYTMIHDDLCDGSTPGITGVADTVAYNRGIVLGSGAIVQECENNNFYDRLKTFASHGHEIVSHSWSHVDATQGWNADQEIVKSKATLEQKLEGINITFFIFPFDNYDTKALNALDAAGYISARAGPAPYGGDRGVVTNLAQFKPFGGVLFDVWGPSQSIYKTQDCLQKHVEAAISGGGW